MFTRMWRLLLPKGPLCNIQSARRWQHVTVSPEEPEVQALLNSLTGVDLYKVMARRREPLLVPHYKLMNMEQLQEAQMKATEKAKAMLKTPPILSERLPCGEVIEVDENLAGAITNRMIFIETSQHKENQLRYVAVREKDGVLRQATWEEKDRMFQVFFPAIGRKMWLPRVLTEDFLPLALDKKLHLSVLDLVCAQCDPQSRDYHRVHHHVYEDIEKRGSYDLLHSSRYFGCLVWHLLTFSDPPRIYGLLKHMLKHHLLVDAAKVIRLYMLCFPDAEITVELRDQTPSESELVKKFCQLSHFLTEIEEPNEIHS